LNKKEKIKQSKTREEIKQKDREEESDVGSNSSKSNL